MSQTEEIFKGDSYEVIAWANNQKIILYQTFGDYTGEWVLIAKGESQYYIYKGCYGSCGGCDHLQGFFDWGPILMAQAQEFAKDYPAFVEVPRQTAVNLVQNGTLGKIFPLNVRDRYSEIAYDDVIADTSVAIKIEENLDIAPQDVLKCKNQEIKQRALKIVGYERFVNETSAEVVDTDSVNELLALDDIRLVKVKDSSSDRTYLLRVPPHITRVKEGIAWTFGLTENEYNPLIET